ncbi:methyltransferase domain-containing protein [Reichenbachiella sp.]
MKVEMGLRESKVCFNCGNESFKVLYKWGKNHYDHEKFETASWDGRQEFDLQIVTCTNCRIVYTNPSFKTENLGLIYPEDLVHSENRTKKELLKEKKWNDLIDKVTHFLPKGSSICDVGARYGILTEKFKALNYISFGIELNQGAVDFAKSIDVKNIFTSDIGGINEVVKKLNLESVNAFVLDDVLEHLVNPVAELQTLSQFQNKNDILVLRQMNHNSLGRRLFRKMWYYYQPAAHMYFFDDDSMQILLNKIGYEIVGNFKTPLLKQIKPLIVQILRFLRIKKYLMPIQKNGKIMYLDKRYKLEDMFLIIARKKA